MASNEGNGVATRMSGVTKVAVGLLTLLTAALTAATAYLGYRNSMVSEARDVVATQAEDLSGDVADLTSQVDALTSERDALQRENAELRRAAGGPGSSGGDASEPAIRRTGPLSVTPTSGRSDLDAPASDPQWGRLENDVSDEDGPKLSGTSHFHFANQRYSVLREGVADYATCSTVTAWITTLSDLDVLLPGTQLCAVTTDDRFAGLAVTEVTPDTVTFEVTTWETPSS